MGVTVDVAYKSLNKFSEILCGDKVEILQTKKKLNEMLAANTGQPYDVIAADTERDRWMTAEEAKAYGLIDEIVASR